MAAKKKNVNNNKSRGKKTTVVADPSSSSSLRRFVVMVILPVLVAVLIAFVLPQFIQNNNNETTESSSSSSSSSLYDRDRATKLHHEGLRILPTSHHADGLTTCLDLFTRAVDADPTLWSAYNSKAGVLRKLGQSVAALQVLQDGLQRANHAASVPSNDPEFAGSMALLHQGLFFVHSDLHQPEQAVVHIQKAIEYSPNPGYYVAWAGLNTNHHRRGGNFSISWDEKIQLYHAALALDPHDISARCLRYHGYAMVGNWTALETEYDVVHQYSQQVILSSSSSTKSRDQTTDYCLQPYMMAYLNFSAALMRDTAIYFAHYREAHALASSPLHLSWDDIIEPLYKQVINDEDGTSKQVRRKLRIGYVSSDLHSHPVGRNMLGVFMAHNRKRFDVFCFVTRHDATDPITAMVPPYVTEYVDLTTWQHADKTHAQLADWIRSTYRIDVLMDLNGWTDGRRLELFAARTAPVQISHGLGFVGTTGMSSSSPSLPPYTAGGMDYFISDTIASPARFDEYYTEQVIRLPTTYLPASHATIHVTEQGADYNPRNADKMALRAQYGLPTSNTNNVEDQAGAGVAAAAPFVYCSFQSLHKMSRESFDAWMRILQRTTANVNNDNNNNNSSTTQPSSILWITTVSSTASQQRLLEHAARVHGIGADRFVFGQGLAVGKHLTRAQACDLHLDSWPYNAHSTAVDVTWAGVPLLAYLPDYYKDKHQFPNNNVNDDDDNAERMDGGSDVPATAGNDDDDVPKMCSRVSSSILHFLGMPQLITTTLQDFENEAVRYAQDAQAYTSLRNELLEKRLSSAVFDLIAYTRYHEAAYLEVFERFLRGEAPSPLNVPPKSK